MDRLNNIHMYIGCERVGIAFASQQPLPLNKNLNTSTLNSKSTVNARLKAMLNSGFKIAGGICNQAIAGRG